MKPRGNRGFTLIEAAVAIAVVAILAGIIVPLVVKSLQDSQMARAKNDVQVITAAVASQLKDTGCRPAAVGPDGSTGAGYAFWQSGGAAPTVNGAPLALTAANTFTSLFTKDKSLATTQQLFFGTTTAVTAANEFSYRGPYMAGDVALKSDPWGTCYLIAGYNANGQTNNGPIWIVCFGPDKATVDKNLPTGANPPSVWDGTTTGIDDIVARAN